MASEITIDGVVLNLANNDWSQFTMSFSLSGGTYLSAGCDSWMMNAQVTDFHATFAAPSTFLANLTRTPYPCGGQVYAELVSATVTLQSVGDLFAPGSSLTGYFGTMQIEDATWHINSPAQVSTPEPGTLALLLIAALAWGCCSGYFSRLSSGR